MEEIVVVLTLPLLLLLPPCAASLLLFTLTLPCSTNIFLLFLPHLFFTKKGDIASGVNPSMEGMSKLDLNKQMREKPRVVPVVKKEEEDFDDELQVDRKKKGGVKRSSSSSSSSGGGGGGAMRRCQADRCTADLSEEKQYHRKHKVCDLHSKSQVVLVSGLHQRFCQQCSRFHQLPEFDDTKRSCRRRLAGHNERRRKNPAESHAVEGCSRNVGAGTQFKDVCGQVDDSGRIRITIPGNSTHKHFHIR